MIGSEKLCGIVLAGGAGSRLHPMTHSVSKQLLPVYDKPMIYYPLSTLMMAGIRDILVITTPRDHVAFESLLGDGSELGITLQYCQQPRPEGLAQAFQLGRSFVGSRHVALVLGDNIFYGPRLSQHLCAARERTHGASIFAYQVADPERYGIVEFDAQGRAVSLQEKPAEPASNYAVTGLYFYDNQVLDIAASLQPSARGELEITDVNQAYLDQGDLHVEVFQRGFAWLDTGTPTSLMQAASFVEAIDQRQGIKIGCIEEVAYRQGFIDADTLRRHGQRLQKNAYGQHLLDVASESPLSVSPAVLPPVTTEAAALFHPTPLT